MDATKGVKTQTFPIILLLVSFNSSFPDILLVNLMMHYLSQTYLLLSGLKLQASLWETIFWQGVNNSTVSTFNTLSNTIILSVESISW